MFFYSLYPIIILLECKKFLIVGLFKKIINKIIVSCFFLWFISYHYFIRMQEVSDSRDFFKKY